MKIKKENFYGLLVFVIILSGIIFIYRWEKSKSHGKLAKQIAELSPRGGIPETFDGLRKAIALYEDQIELNLKDGVKTASYWKILAVRYTDKKMYNEALKALERAIYYNGEDPVLFNLAGLSASVVAKNALGFPSEDEKQRERYFDLAERSYLRAVELDPDYAKPRYGLGILYSFELDRPEDAVPHLERYLEMMSKDFEAVFALARACYMSGNNRRAVELYDRIIRESKNATQKAEAQENKELILGLEND